MRVDPVEILATDAGSVRATRCRFCSTEWELDVETAGGYRRVDRTGLNRETGLYETADGAFPTLFGAMADALRAACEVRA